MKKLLSLFIISLVFISACGNKDNNPKAVAKKFLNHINNREYAEAKKCATPESSTMIDLIESTDKMKNDNHTQGSLGNKYANLKCKIEDDKAICKYTMNDKDKKIHLVKNDGTWLVDYKKESFDDKDGWVDDEGYE